LQINLRIVRSMKFTKASIRPSFGFVYTSDDGNAKNGKLHIPHQRRAKPDLRR